MAAEKVTIMVLKVDLQCRSCYKKVKKILCKFPQISTQVYNEKANTVTITVVCCSPEKIRDKLCYKGAKVIKSIEIKGPPKPANDPNCKPNTAARESEKPGQPPVVIEKSDKPTEKAPATGERPVPQLNPPRPPVICPPACACMQPGCKGSCMRPPVICPPACACMRPGWPPACVCKWPWCNGSCVCGFFPQPCQCGCGGWGCGQAHWCGHYFYFTEENPSSCSIM